MPPWGNSNGENDPQHHWYSANWINRNKIRKDHDQIVGIIKWQKPALNVGIIIKSSIGCSRICLHGVNSMNH